MKMFRKILPVLRSNLCSGSLMSVPQSSEGVVKNALLARATATTKFYHTSPVLECLFRRGGRSKALKSLQKRAQKDKAMGEYDFINDPAAQADVIYPTAKSAFKLYDGVMFKDLPIVTISASPNNTKISVADKNGKVELLRTAGTEGHKNSRRGSSVAAQSTAVTIGKKMILMGIRTVRVCLSGLGLGRAVSVQGLTLAGVNIVSVTDTTPISFNPPRPKKQRRL